MQEASSAVAKLHNDKSPGPDGFTSNFFKLSWKHLGIFLVRFLNYSFKNGHLSLSQRQGMNTLIPKSGKSKDRIENWRPVSLLNTTPNILSAAIANRLRKVMDKLTSINQKGFMKNRYIGECIRTVYYTMWDAKHTGLDKKE